MPKSLEAAVALRRMMERRGVAEFYVYDIYTNNVMQKKRKSCSGASLNGIGSAICFRDLLIRVNVLLYTPF